MYVYDDLMFFVCSLYSTMLGIGDVACENQNSVFKGL
jgi:hypothetical protein